MGGTSALVLNSVNCTALSVLPLVWMSQKNLCLQHFFLKGWDEAREIHAYPPGENNSTSFWIIFMMTVLMRILFTIITIHIMVKTFCLSVGEERSLQKVRILRICRLCRPKSCEVDFSFIHLLCIWNSCWNIAQTFKEYFHHSGSRMMPWVLSSGGSKIKQAKTKFPQFCHLPWSPQRCSP